MMSFFSMNLPNKLVHNQSHRAEQMRLVFKINIVGIFFFHRQDELLSCCRKSPRLGAVDEICQTEISWKGSDNWIIVISARVYVHISNCALLCNSYLSGGRLRITPGSGRCRDNLAAGGPLSV